MYVYLSFEHLKINYNYEKTVKKANFWQCVKDVYVSLTPIKHWLN